MKDGHNVYDNVYCIMRNIYLTCILLFTLNNTFVNRHYLSMTYTGKSM
jgi:hypothetical protein